jgi:RNA polymerase sigma factor (TIGR02999 family)
MTGADDVTGWLRAWGRGDDEARDRLVAVLYQDLRRRAGGRMRNERPGHVMQPTALVHETFLRLVDQKQIAWENRAQFLGVASEMMRRILVDHARARKMAKRSGRWSKVIVDEAVAGVPPREIDLLNLDEAMRKLAEFDSRKGRIVELRFFGGLSLEETSHVLGISVATVERDWQAARAWLYLQMKGKT